MATIETYTLASGAKRYRVRYRTPENRSTDKSGFTTRRDAQAFAATLEVSKLSGTYIAPAAGRMTVGQVARQWLDSSSATVKATTMAKHESAWSFRVEPRWGSVAVSDVRPPAIKAWVAQLHSAGVGAASIESALDVLRGALGTALDDRALLVNPAAGVKPPRRKLSKRGYLTIPQVEALAVEAMTGRPEFGTVVGFLAYTGLRWGEMAALRVESFDMLRRRVHVTEAVAEVRGKLVWGTPKDHERRSVPFPAFLAPPLAQLMKGKARGDLVFTGAKGAVLAVSRFRPRVFAPAVSRAREADATFPIVTPHDLRHTAASLAVSAGANVKAVQTMLGHASAVLTLDTYSDLFPDDLDAVAARLDDAVRKQSVGFLWVPDSRGPAQNPGQGL
jgi:integrase